MNTIQASPQQTTTVSRLSETASDLSSNSLRPEMKAGGRVMHQCPCRTAGIPSPEIQTTSGAGDLKGLEALLSSLTDTLTLLVEHLIQALAGAIKPPSAVTNGTAGAAAQNAAANTGAAAVQPTTATAAGASPFKQHLLKLYSGQEKLSEAELRNGIVNFQLSQLSPPLNERYAKEYESLRKAGTTVSASVKAALKSLQSAGVLPAKDAKWVFSLSARAAQLDDNTTRLQTTAGASAHCELKNALQIAEVNLASIQSGSIQVKLLSF